MYVHTYILNRFFINLYVKFEEIQDTCICSTGGKIKLESYYLRMKANLEQISIFITSIICRNNCNSCKVSLCEKLCLDPVAFFSPCSSQKL